MGQAVSPIIKSLDDQDEKKKEAEDALNILMTLAEDKSQIHYENVINNAINAKLLPVNKVITRMQQINCGVSKDTKGLKSAIESSLNNFVQGEIVDGLVAVAGTALDTLMGNVSANQSQTTNYAITVNNLGGICRIDFCMFYYKYTSEALRSVMEDCLITSLVISSVDTSGLQPNDLRVLVYNNYSAALPHESDGDMMKRQQKIFDLLLANLKPK